jgi:hypothetical protein
MVLDKQGFAELAAAVKQLLERANQIEAQSSRRIAASNHGGVEIDTGLVLMLFEAPPADAGLPEPQRKSQRKPANNSARRRKVA